MPRLSESRRKPLMWCMCNNGIPRYMRDYAISCVSQKISYVFTYKINITFLLLFLCCGKSYPNSNAKLVFIDVLHYIERIITWILYFFLALPPCYVTPAEISPIFLWTIRQLAACLWSVPVCCHRSDSFLPWKYHSWCQTSACVLRNKSCHCTW